ncbi:MAG: glycoside hydrolase family 97 catalytic domain-containing protein [Bacteroidota bacterium]
MKSQILNRAFVVGLLILINVACCYSKENRIDSPNGFVSVELNLNDRGTPEFNVLFSENPVMKNNRLGLIRDDGDFSKNLRLVSVSSTEEIEDQYTLLSGKKINCTYRGNRKVFHFKNREDEEFDIIFQVSNDGVAFRYYFPGKNGEIKRISDELTRFSFDDNTHAWIQPMSAAKSGWNSVNPCYEEYYFYDINIMKLPDNEAGWVFPALFKSGNYWIALAETAPDRNYCACRLIHDSTGFRIGFPQKAEVFPGGSLNPESKMPWYTPWRIITLANNLGTLVESTLGTDLAKPSVLSDISFVKPGRSSWSWVLFKDDSTVFHVQKRFVDYAAEMGWEYCLVDADWDRKIGYEKLGELCNYAASKGVGITAWYNSAGSWNTTPYTPRDKLLTKELRDAEFKKLRGLGVKGIKVDFFGADGQSMMVYYQDIIEDAARNGLMVNCHGSTIPRGWQRTYPNLVSMEAIRGFEYVTFEQLNADREAGHCTVIPFTRNLFDPMDFTPVCFSEVPNIRRRTTNGFELALSVLFFSGVQHFAEVPEGIAKVPAEIRQILKDVPVAWDESKFIDGYPGKYVVIARRKENVWYIAGINGESIEKKLEMNIGFIKDPGASLLITGGKNDRSFEIRNDNIDLSQPLIITLRPNDGFVFRISGK